MERNKLKYEREKKTCIYVAPKKENKIGNALIHTIEITNKSTIYGSCPQQADSSAFQKKMSNWKQVHDLIKDSKQRWSVIGTENQDPG